MRFDLWVKRHIWNLVFYLPGSAVRALFSIGFTRRLLVRSGFPVKALQPLVRLLARGEKGYFLEIGANDGVSQSNSKDLELAGWSGTLVEPHPGNFRRLHKTRSRQSNLVCAACVPFGFSSDFLELTYLDLMTFSKGLNSDLESFDEHINAGSQNFRAEQPGKVFKAVAKNLESVLEDVNAPSVIDFFSLDVEGAELAVLQGVDHAKYRFKVLIVESRDLARLSSNLEAWGYEYFGQLSGIDHLFGAKEFAQPTRSKLASILES